MIGWTAVDQPVHLRGCSLETGQELDCWLLDGILIDGPVGGCLTVDDVTVLPGLVDAHCHVGLAAAGAVSLPQASEQARLDLQSGVTLIRDAGSPVDTHLLSADRSLPRIIRAGRHIARPKRYIRGFAVEVEPEELVGEVERQAQAGDGWVKLVGDWIDRERGCLAPLWPESVAMEAIAAAHRLGARVTAHCFGDEAPAQLVAAGIDCIEHGCGLDASSIEQMARQGVALVPTLDNLNIFPGIAALADDRYPAYARQMRGLYARRFDVIRMASEAGVDIYAGTDAGGNRAHGTLMAEIAALSQVIGRHRAWASASWAARAWLGVTAPHLGEPADCIAFKQADMAAMVVGNDHPQPCLLAHGGRVWLAK
ncbi:MAG: amidohydrolase family protein [Propionibacteriaceae bacterium]|jgi:imidazolonepropionase-like amidohydrolase|nr:amidohydrolase family protein [Propionibacteriaceae bacterium]